MKTFFVGTRRTILLTDEAETTLSRAESHVPPNKAACKAQLRRILERLANVDRLHNPQHFRHEGAGIYAVKARCGLRGYGWFQRLENKDDAFIVSHFIMKKRDAAARADLDRAYEARDRYGRGERL